MPRTALRDSPQRFGYLKWLPVLIVPLAMALALRLTGIQHGRPDMVYHPDVAKQTLVARSIYRGRLDLRRLYADDFKLTLYPYGTAVILGNTFRAYSAAITMPFYMCRVATVA